MNANDRPDGTDVFNDFDPADLIAAAAKRRSEAEQAPEPATSPPKAPRLSKLDPHHMVPFNAKVPRWVRSLTRYVSDDENRDLQDIKADALVLYAEKHGYDVDAWRPKD